MGIGAINEKETISESNSPCYINSQAIVIVYSMITTKKNKKTSLGDAKHR